MASIVSLLTKVLAPNTTSSTSVATVKSGAVGGNPFGNPFVNSRSYTGYAQNRPVNGGYFAGYYNNKPNIVGQRLFIEV